MSKDKPSPELVIAVIVTFILFFLATKIMIANVIYNEWTCAFAHCTKVK